MIVMRYQNDLLFILEPGNVDKMQIGQPVVKKLKQFIPELSEDFQIILAWTPDVQWVSEQLLKGKPVGKVLEASLLREEIHQRPTHSTEEVIGPVDL